MLHCATLSRRRLLIAAVAIAIAMPAGAASQRTFVATSGIDAGACTAPAPCRTFQFALGQTNPGGEIVVLESGGYGQVTIAKSITIVAPQGVYAGITGLAGNAVNVDGAGIVVTMRGLSINGQGGAYGVRLVNAATLQLESCVIAGFAQDGVYAAGGSGRLLIDESQVRDNQKAGINVDGPYRAIVEQSRIDDNGSFAGGVGLWLRNGADGTVRSSRLSRNAYGNIRLTGANDKTVRVDVSDSLLADGEMAVSGGSGVYGENDTSNGVVQIVATRNVLRANFHHLLISGSATASSTLVATGNTATGNNGSWAYGATGAGSVLVLAGNSASMGLWGIYASDGAIVQSANDNVVYGASIGATAVPVTKF
jgi:hypothetical protein